MTDTLSRTRQRQSLEGDLARAAWLTQRLRQGELTHAQGRLAAQLGDPAARLLIGDVEQVGALPGWRDRAWKLAFRPAGRRPLAFLAWQAGRDALALGQGWSRVSHHLGRPTLEDLQHLEQVLVAARAWLERPSRGRQRALLALRSEEDTWDPVTGNIAGQQTRWLTVRLIDTVLDWPADPAVRDVLTARRLLGMWARQGRRQPSFQDEAATALRTWLLEGRADWSLPKPPRLPEPANSGAASSVPLFALGAFGRDPIGLPLTVGVVGLTVVLVGVALGSLHGMVLGVSILTSWTLERFAFA